MTDASRILVFIPNWVGDVVMATAALRAVRRRFAGARIVHLMRRYVGDVLAGTEFCDARLFWPDAAGPAADAEAQGGSGGLLRRLRGERFDLAILLTNSFRSAWVARLSGARRRVGYAREARGWLLTDRLKAPRAGRRWVPIPALDYYNALARHVGCEAPGDELELATSRSDETSIEQRLGRVDPQQPIVVLNPGAGYGPAKCWPAESYAELSDALVSRYGARVVASLGPKEREIGDRLRASARQAIEVFVDPALGLGPLKALIRRCQLLITNDTGPRHFAAAFGVPVVTVFGSSDPAWTETRYALERPVTLDLDCQPCMERTCPLKHHRCMRDLGMELVFAQAASLLTSRGVRPIEVSRPCS